MSKAQEENMQKKGENKSANKTKACNGRVKKEKTKTKKEKTYCQPSSRTNVYWMERI